MNWFKQSVNRSYLKAEVFITILTSHTQGWGEKPAIRESDEVQLIVQMEVTAHTFRQSILIDIHDVAL